MTEREKEVYGLIEKNPMISQEEISEKLKIARSSVGVHISNLMKKGHILGKGYVLKDRPYVLVIGGANIDIEGYPVNSLKFKDSNPGIVKRSFGGVGRNIAENISRLGVESKLITLVGNDSSGVDLLEYCRDLGIDILGSEILDGESTSTYLSILGDSMDMEVAISHMDIMEKLDEKFLSKRQNIIRGAKICVVDTNLPKKTLRYLLNNFDIPFAVDTVSLEKSKKIEGLYHRIDTLKPNLLEAEAISGTTIKTNDDIEKAAKIIIDKGIKNVFISLGSKGVYYSNGSEKGFLTPPRVDVKSSTGAGDAYIAGVLKGKVEDKPINIQAMLGMAASICALKSNKSIAEDINNKKVFEILEEVERCNFTKNI